MKDSTNYALWLFIICVILGLLGVWDAILHSVE